MTQPLNDLEARARELVNKLVSQIQDEDFRDWNVAYHTAKEALQLTAKEATRVERNRCANIADDVHNLPTGYIVHKKDTASDISTEIARAIRNSQ